MSLRPGSMLYPFLLCGPSVSDGRRGAVEHARGVLVPDERLGQRHDGGERLRARQRAQLTCALATREAEAIRHGALLDGQQRRCRPHARDFLDHHRPRRGVQSETAVRSMVDFFLLLMLAGAGDELQGMKRGVVEMADLIAINKADGANLPRAKQARQDFENALRLRK